MHHNLPMSHFWGHGFFKYDPKFFIMLSNTNKYNILESKFYDVEGDADKFVKEYLTQNNFDVKSRHLAVEFIFQKTNATPFQIPLNLDIQGMASELLKSNYNLEKV